LDESATNDYNARLNRKALAISNKGRGGSACEGLFSLSLWEREGERDLRSANTLPLFPLPKGKGMKRYISREELEHFG
jgi:hypothetical protein